MKIGIGLILLATSAVAAEQSVNVKAGKWETTAPLL